VLLAMYRVAFPKVQAASSALCLAISNGEVEITVISQGQIRLYRRIDMGRHNLFTGAARVEAPTPQYDSKPAARPLFTEEEEEPAAAESGPAAVARQINVAAASSLVVEIQRSLDYYSSQYTQAETVTHAVLATHDPELKALAGWLGQALSVEMAVAELPADGAASPAVFAQLDGPESVRYLGAVGLALHALPGAPTAIPQFDLSTGQKERKTIQVGFGERRPMIALALSVLFLVTGGTFAFSIGRKASSLASALEGRKAELQRKQKTRQDLLNRVQAQAEQLRVLSVKGIPFPRIMDTVAVAVAPEVGLTGISLDPTGKLLITGEAANEKALIKTLEGLKSSPFFEGTSLDGFDSKTPPGATTALVRFQISAKLVGTDAPATTTASAH
jgi:hypothetical protein